MYGGSQTPSVVKLKSGINSSHKGNLENKTNLFDGATQQNKIPTLNISILMHLITLNVHIMYNISILMHLITLNVHIIYNIIILLK